MKKIVLLSSLVCILISNIVYGQKNLSHFIEVALQNSPLIKTNGLQTQANQLEANKIVASLQKPIIGTSYNYLFAPMYANDPSNTGLKLNPPKTINDYYGYDLSATNGGLYQALLTIQQPLFNKQRVQAINNQLAIQNQIVNNSSVLSNHDLEKFVTDQYIICLQDIEQQKAIQNIQSVIQKQIQITQKLSAGGLARQGDYKVLEIELEQQNTNLQALKNSYKAHLLQLYSICGINDSTIVELAPLNLQISSALDSYQSGFIKQFQLDSLNLTAAQNIFNTQYRPIVSLYSSAGLNAVYLPTIYKRLGWEVGIMVTQRIFDGHQRKMNDEKTKILQQSTAINSQFFVQKNESQKKSFLQVIHSADEQIEAVQKQIKDYDTLINYYQNQIINGQGSVIDYITILRSSAALQLNIATLQTNRLLAINNYNYWNW
jgi:outer membrane protein TolC